MIRGAGGRRSIWGNRKRMFDEMGEMTRMCSIDEIKGRDFKWKGIVSSMKCY